MEARRIIGKPIVVALVALAIIATSSCSGSGNNDDRSEPAAGEATEEPEAQTPDDGDPLAPKPLPEKTKVVVNTAAMLEYAAPVTLAAALGEFEKENLDVDVQVTLTQMQAVATGEMDAAWAAPDASWLNGVASGLEVRWVAGNYLPPDGTTAGLWMWKDKVSGPEDLDELKGMKISTSQGPGGVTSYFVDKLLEGTDVDLTDIEFIQLTPADTLIALENGSVDGAWLIDPLQNEVAENTDFVFVGGPPMDTVGGGLFFGKRLLDPANRDIAEAFVRALARTIDLYLQPGYHNDPKIVEELARLGEVPEEAITGAEELRFDLHISSGLIEDMQDSWSKQGVFEFDATIPDDEFVNRTFVEAVLGEN